MRGFIVRVISFFVLALVVIEIIFRLPLPAADMPKGYQDPEFMIVLHDTTGTRSGLHTMGRFCRPAFRWNINNFGANSAENFRSAEAKQRPCIAAIGNSYLQGLYSDVDEHLSASLQTLLSNEVAVYNLGTSGISLSQAILVATFARHHFSPDMLIIQVNHSSLRNSVRDLGFLPYSAQFRSTDTGWVLGEPSPFRVSRKKRLLRRSALVRYLFYNANVNFGGGIVQEAGQNPAPAKDPDRLAHEEAMKREVLRLTLSTLQEENPGIPILVLLDTDRRQIYETGGQVCPLQDSPIYSEICAVMGVHFIDLSERMAREYRSNGLRFEFDDNYHWNPYGVSIVADEIAGYMTSSGLLPELLK